MEFQEGQKLTLQDLANWFKIFGQSLLNHIRYFLIYNVQGKKHIINKITPIALILSTYYI